MLSWHSGCALIGLLSLQMYFLDMCWQRGERDLSLFCHLEPEQLGWVAKLLLECWPYLSPSGPPALFALGNLWWCLGRDGGGSIRYNGLLKT